MSIAVASPQERLSERSMSTLEELYAETGAVNFTPGWVPRKKPVLYREPRPKFAPAHWRYDNAKAGLDAAGTLVDVALAERRNLIMRNPSPSTDFETSRTLVCAYQMILPGEKAPSHRHSSHALRVIIDGKGSFSTVDGQKMPMETGDVVLTPGWCWHGHGHDGDQPAYWFDGLDVPLTQLLEPVFFDEHPDKYQKVERVVETSPYRFKRDAIAQRLDAVKPEVDGFYGRRVTLEAASMPTIGLVVERLNGGVQTRAYRTTANIVFHVMEGTGESQIGGEEFAWQRGDTFVAPCWNAISHKAQSDAQLFAMSDEPLLRFSKYYRMEPIA